MPRFSVELQTVPGDKGEGLHAVKKRSKRTRCKYEITEEAFKDLWEAQGGRCAICGISETELESGARPRNAFQRLPHNIISALPRETLVDLSVALSIGDTEHLAGYEAIFGGMLKYFEDFKELRSDRTLHVDHERGSSPPRIRGLLCWQCNYDLEAFITKRVILHPGGHGASLPRNDPRFVKYLREREGARIASTDTNRASIVSPVGESTHEARKRNERE
jgi:hypothetical protein